MEQHILKVSLIIEVATEKVETQSKFKKFTFLTKTGIPSKSLCHKSMEQPTLTNANNGKKSTVNKSLDGSMYPG